MSLFGDIVEVGTLGLYDPDAAGEAAQRGAERSAEATIAATEKNIAFQKWLWGEQKELARPYAEMGTAAIPEYERLRKEPIDVMADPSYQFRLTEGQKAYETSGAAKGMQLSGAQAKKLTRYGQDYASTEYGKAFNRRQANLDNLYRMITSGQAAAAGQAATGGQMGAQVSSSIGEAGRATSQMYSDVGNIQAAQAQAPWNMLMDVGGLAASYYGAQ